MVYGVTSVVEAEPRFGPVYRHLGIVDHLLRYQEINGSIDAYFNWPGFFAFAAFLVAAGDLGDAFAFAGWTPLVSNLLYLGPLFLIMRSLTEDRRVVWLGVWIFMLTNWVGQDYFSPQSFSYFLYLVILAITLRWFSPVARTSLAKVGGAVGAALGDLYAHPGTSSRP